MDVDGTWVRCSWRPEESVGFPGAGVSGTCELLNMGAAN